MKRYEVATTAKNLIRSLGQYRADGTGLLVPSALVLNSPRTGRSWEGIQNSILSRYSTSAYRTRKPTLSARHDLSDRIRLLALVATKY